MGVFVGSSVNGALALLALTGVVTAVLGTGILISLVQSGQGSEYQKVIGYMIEVT